MSIKIEIEHVQKYGYPYVVINKVHNMFKENQLPEEYLKGKIAVYKETGRTLYYSYSESIIVIKNGSIKKRHTYRIDNKKIWFPVDEFNKMIKEIRKAGKQLMVVNRRARIRAGVTRKFAVLRKGFSIAEEETIKI